MKLELGWKWGRACAAETRLYLGQFINMPPLVPSEYSAQPPFCPYFAQSEPSLQMLTNLSLRSFFVSFSFTLLKPTPPLSVYPLRWWANWYRFGSTSVRPAPCGMTWWRRMMCRLTWSVSPISSTTSRSKRSPIYGSCRKCWLVLCFSHAQTKADNVSGKLWSFIRKACLANCWNGACLCFPLGS